MTLSAAKARLDPAVGEVEGYISPADHKASYDDLQDAWQAGDNFVAAAAANAQSAADAAAVDAAAAQSAADAAQADADAAAVAAAAAQATADAALAGGGGGTGSGLGWFNVKDFTATGNGVTDDTADIQAAINAIPASGGVLFFPPGRYRISAPLVLKSYVHVVGSEPASRYWTYSSSSPTSACAIEVMDSFVGAQVFTCTNLTAYSFQNITILGRNVGTVHGIVTAAGTEMNALFSNVAVIGMGGCGIRGHMWAARFRGIYVGGCRQWGMQATTYWADVHISDSFIAGCVSGGISLAGSVNSGFVTIHQTRVERSGFDSNNPTTPTNASAPGIYITRCVDSNFTSVETDGNTGHGLHIASANTGHVYNLGFANCAFRRDGPGNFSSLGDFAGVRLEATGGAELGHVWFRDCQVQSAKASDDGSYPAYTHPKYGVWADHTTYLKWNGGRVTANTAAWYAGGAALSASNYRPQIDLQQDMVATGPAGSTGSRPTGTWIGQGYFDTTIGKPIWWNGSNWKDAAGTTV